MFPIPPVTLNLILACVAMYCVDVIDRQGFVKLWLSFWPIGSGRFMPWQLLTYAFLHGSMTHLMMNLLGLWMFGSELERLWGRRKFIIFAAVCAVTAAAAQVVVSLFMLGGPMIGISGVVYGLLLAYALAFPDREFELIGTLPILLMMLPSQTLNVLGLVLFVVINGNRQALPIPMVFVRALPMVLIFGGIELFLGLFVHTGIAHFAHLGGMLGAWLMVKFWRSGGGRRRR